MAISSAAGSGNVMTYQKKVPDHQMQAVAKVRPFSLLNKERFSSPDGGRRMPQGIKTFADCETVASKLHEYDTKIKQVKNYGEFDDLTSMYIEGESKLKMEFDAARRIKSPDRKLIVLNESIAR